MSDCDELKAKRSVLKGLCTKALNRLREARKTDLSRRKLLYDKLCVKFDECQNIHVKYLTNLESKGETDLTKAESCYLDDLEGEIDDEFLLLQSNIKDSKTVAEKTASMVADVDQKKKSPQDTIFKVNQLEMEKFTGDILKYLGWKEDVQRHYLPHISEGSLRMLALKKLLDPAISMKVIGLESCDEIWLELDSLYGDKSKISAQILNDIDKIPQILDEDINGFIKFAERLSLANVQLMKFHMESDLNNSHMLGIIERKLPVRMKAEWSEIIVSSVKTNKTKFTQLLEFIKLKAKAKEYEIDSIRSIPSNAHSNHGTSTGPNHGSFRNSRPNPFHGISPGNPGPFRGSNNHPGTHTGSNTGGPHWNSTGQSSCLVHFRRMSSHETGQCSVFLAMTPVERRSLVLRARACFVCLLRGHQSSTCTSGFRCYVPGCSEQHHGLLHESGTKTFYNPNVVTANRDHNSMYGTTYGTTRPNVNPFNTNPFHTPGNFTPPPPPPGNSTPPPPPPGNFTPPPPPANVYHQQTLSGPNPMLPFQNVTSGSGNFELSVLFDSGSTLSIITDSIAKALRLTMIGKRTVNLIKTGGQGEIIDSFMYVVPLLTETGNVINVNALGLKKISGDLEKVENSSIERLFDIPMDSLRRPFGQVDLLVGTDAAGLHPVPVTNCENMVLGKNPFGMVAWGSHPNSECSHVTPKVALMNNVTMDDFFQVESMGIECTPRCGSCRCGSCPLGAKPYTIKEEKELELVRKGLKFDDVNNHWVCTYPWVKDPKELPNNYYFIAAQLKSLERRLGKSSELMKLYDAQIHDMVDRGVARICSKQELSVYDGPVYYLSHHEVIKETSTTTPCRIVFNPAQNFKGHILNDYWALGTNLVQSLFDVLLRFREFEFGVIGDVSKMYHSVRTTPLEWHTHRFLWRNFEDRRPDVYIFTRNSFGDKPAGTIAIMAIIMTVEKYGDAHPLGSETLQNSLYVDDIADSKPTLEEAREVMHDTEQLLAKGGFKIKEWNTTGGGGTAEISQLSAQVNRVLGMIMDSRNDTLKFNMKLNFSRGKQRKSTGADLTAADVPSKVPASLTKRHIASQVNGVYDLLGLIAPFIAKAKINLRKLWMFKDAITNCKLEWDDAMPTDLRDRWIEWFREAFELNTIEFDRCLTPSPIPSNPPLLIMFSDASNDCMAAVAYIRYQTGPSEFHCRLIAAKTRATPLQVKTIVQYEMQAAVMSKRLAVTLTKAMRIHFSDTIFIVDSEIVRAMICKDSYGFNTWYAVRVGEIVSHSDPRQWCWIEGKLNIADWATRGKAPSELGKDSEWQRGPKFLYTERGEWPIKQSFSGAKLPGLRAHLTTTPAAARLNVSSIVDIERPATITKLLFVTARVLNVFEKLSFQAVLEQPTVANYYQARKLWIQAAQNDALHGKRSLIESYKAGEFDKLVPFWDNHGTLRVKGRVFDEGLLAPAILPQSHRLSRLIIEEIHERNHEGISTVVSKARENYWIIGAARLAKTVRHHCMTCRRRYGDLHKQIMSELPPERTRVSLPFTHVSIDLFGRYDLRIPGKSTRGRQFTDEKKAYGVIYTCLSSRAIYVDVARGYSLDAFLLVHRRFLSIRGAPDTLYSDGGPQLTAADKELHQDLMKNWDMDTLLRHGVKLGTTWKFCAPESPWQNGVSEALIKGVKRSLNLVLGDHPKLTFEELQTAMFEVANILNERPIGRHPTSPDECAFLRPNDLLLGRSTARIPAGPWRPGSNKQRFVLVQSVVNDWAKRWLRDYFPTLVPRKRWHTASRQIEVGDLVLIQDENFVRGDWKMGQVTRVHPSADGRVRNVDIRYKNAPTGEPHNQYNGVKDSTLTRSVQRLVVIATAQELSS